MAKIVDVTPFQYHTPGINMVFVRIRTDDGYEGIGEGTIPHKTRAVAGTVEEFAGYLVGKDPSQIERHWQVLYRNSFHRGGPIQGTALSAVDQALWDIRGKVLGRPVWDLLGGAVRDRIRVYTHPHGATPEALVASVQGLLAEGYRGFKLQVPKTVEPILDEQAVDQTVANVAAVREAVGPDVDLMVDAHGKMAPSVALRLAHALAPFHLLFLEEPVFPGNVDALATVTRSSPIPIAVGERLYNRWDFREVVEKQAAAVLQPDVGHAGGISEVRRIAAQGEVYFGYLAPHNPRGPGVTTASLHLDACVPNFLTQEVTADNTLRREMLLDGWDVVDGYVALPTAPGLGIRFDQAWLERYPFTPKDAGHPVLADGGVGDW